MAGEQKQDVDLEKVELAYRAGVIPLRQLGALHGVSAATLLKWAKKYGWERDLSAKIQAKADAKVNAAAVNKPVNVNKDVHERETIEANAEAIARVRLGHRTDISKGRSLVVKLLAELEGVTDRPDLIEELQQALVDPGDDSQAAEQRRRKLGEMLQRVTELPAKVSAVKGLAEAMKNLIGLERQAWGMESDAGGGGSYEEFLQSLST